MAFAPTVAPTVMGNNMPYYDYNDLSKGYVRLVNPNIANTQIGYSSGNMNIPSGATPPYVANTGVQIPAPIMEAKPAWSASTSTTPTTPTSTTPVLGEGQFTVGNDVYQRVGNGAFNTQNSNWGINSNGQKTFMGGTGYDWASAGINTAFGLFNAYQSYQANKLAKAQFEDQRRLNHANYQMQAKAYNNNLRNQQSGRGYVGMAQSAKRALGREYETRKAKDDY